MRSFSLLPEAEAASLLRAGKKRVKRGLTTTVFFNVNTCVYACLFRQTHHWHALTNTESFFFPPVLSSVGDQYFNRKWIQSCVPLKEHRFLLCSAQGQCREQDQRISSPRKFRQSSQSIHWRKLEHKWSSQRSRPTPLWPCMIAVKRNDWTFEARSCFRLKKKKLKKLAGVLRKQ